MSVHLFGVRHHGPGCARSLRAALEALAPDVVLVEGPPDAQEVLPLLAHPEMAPPVALLVYAPERPRDAAYYPFVRYSPEWQALAYALERGVPARFIDLPQAYQLGREEERTPTEVGRAAEEEPPGAPVEDDPIGELAAAAGYADRELWWEVQVERRRDPTDLFAAILEAMRELRAHAPAPEGTEARREAWMRRAIRAAEGEGYARVAVVCGAWHAPALLDGPGPRADAELLRGLKKTRVEATWAPWTNGRLSYRSGYGAGVRSPGWYEHLWEHPPTGDGGAGIEVRWVARAARLLRGEDLDASSASVIEAVRLADALAAMRGLPMPGLGELHEAIQSVLCGGEAARMALIRARLEIGERLGAVPEETTSVPLARDLATLQRRLRLKPSAEDRVVDLDLRNETDRERSRLLRRLGMLGVPWGGPEEAPGKSGTFHELWRLRWHPEFSVALVEASIWGNTVESAASAWVGAEADRAPDLPALSALLDAAILGGLADAVDHLLARVRDQAAVSADVLHLMRALPPLARISRYGDVRGSGAAEVDPVIGAIFGRALVGLPGAYRALDDEAAQKLVRGMGAVQESVALLDRAEMRGEWLGALREAAEREEAHGLVRGWACRLLLEQGALGVDDLRTLAGLALSRVRPAPEAAAWVEGVLRGSGLLLLHQDGLWRALDGWMRGLEPDLFTEMLPLLWRAFSGFEPPERRRMGEKVSTLSRGAEAARAGAEVVEEAELDRARADLVLPVLARILGVSDYAGG